MEEEKTYLLKVESNLKEVTEDAVKAKKAWDDSKDSLAKLREEGIKSGPEYEKLSAAVKINGQEYRNAQKNLITLTNANKDNATTREKLNAIITIETKKLNALGDGYIKNKKGLDILNPKYVEQEKAVGDANKALIDYDLSINKGGTNIGRYGETVKAAFVDSGKHILSMVGPLALVGAAIGVVKKVFEGIKEAIASTTFGIDLMNKTATISKQIFYDLAVNGNINVKSITEVSKAQDELNKLRVKDGFELLKLSKLNREEQSIREISIDKTKTHAERLEALNKVAELESEKTKIKVENLREELKIKNDILKQQPANEKLAMELLAISAKINDTYAEEDQIMRRINSQRTGFIQEEIDNRKKLMEAWFTEIEDMNEKEKSLAEQEIKDRIKLKSLEAGNDPEAMKAALKFKYDEEIKNIELTNTQKLILKAEYERGVTEIEQKRIKESQAELQKEVTDTEKLAEDKWNKEVEFQRKIFEQNRADGQSEHDARIAQEKALADAVLEIHEALNESKMRIASSAANFLNAIAGENKALQKASIVADSALAIAEVIIQTTRANATIRGMAAASVLPGPGYLARLGAAMLAAKIPINLNRVSAALDIASIVAAATLQMKNISKGGDSASAPTAISDSAPVQKISAQAVGSSILTQPQLTQPQLNALPNQNVLTADDIALAFSKMPAPVVTVEDINAKTKSVNKVSVRANI